MKLLIGDSGLIGTTLKEKIQFDLQFNSKNIYKYIDIVPNDCDLYLSCLPATKWLVNQNISKDLDNINQILKIIQSKRYNNIFLFSTIDVYCESPQQYNEDNFPIFKTLNYGTNRYIFEKFVDQLLQYKKLMIFRLPALFSKNIKKNILYDLINNNQIEKINGNSMFQWYNLDNLAFDINRISKNCQNNKIFNLFPEPIETSDIIKFFPKITNKISYFKNRTEYNFTTKYHPNNYIKNKQTVLSEIERFINEIRS